MGKQGVANNLNKKSFMKRFIFALMLSILCQRYWKWLMRRHLSVYLLLSHSAPHTPLDPLLSSCWRDKMKDSDLQLEWTIPKQWTGWLLAIILADSIPNANVRLWSKRSIVIRLDWNIASASHFFSCHPFSPLPPSSPAALSSSSHLYSSNLPLSHVKSSYSINIFCPSQMSLWGPTEFVRIKRSFQGWPQSVWGRPL